MAVTLDNKQIRSFISDNELELVEGHVKYAVDTLEKGTGKGADFLGWLKLPSAIGGEMINSIKEAAERIRSNSKVLVVVGIGGSYLGAKSAIDMLCSPFYNQLSRASTKILFLGNTLDPMYLSEVLRLLGDTDFSINVISKSGTTTEPAIAFRILRGILIKKYGEKGASQRIYATTDAKEGTLKAVSDREGYKTFEIPDNVGGRFSVLTAVGLLPMAVAGIDISAVLDGAKTAMHQLSTSDIHSNDCNRYAAYRNLLYRKGFLIELFVTYQPRLAQLSEWLKQLFGESEGKDNMGIFPASVSFSTDLHSLGQYIQDGRRVLFETVINLVKPLEDIRVPEDTENIDGLNFLSGMSLHEINTSAMQGTMIAHSGGGVPNILLKLPSISAMEYGYLVYFFERACAVSGYMLGINPFDQPGVEAYKKNMFALLGKPGFEKLRQELISKL